MTRERKKPHSTERIPWHPAFFDAIRLELERYRDILEFDYEYQLTEEPLKMDVLVIKKVKDAVIEKNIAAIFRENNILEYKSPDDYISVEDFYKVYGYACFYASLNKTPITSLTISFVGERHPRELIRHLKEVRGYTVEEVSDGIYHVKGDIIPIQIIETKKLFHGENLWLPGLSNDLDISRAGAIIKESGRKGKGAHIQAYLNAVFLANPRIVEEALRMRNGTLTLEKVLKDAGLIAKWKAEGEAQGKAEGEEKKALEIARSLIHEGWPVEKIAKTTQLSVEKIRSLYRAHTKRKKEN
jgi:hypothetical protein